MSNEIEEFLQHIATSEKQLERFRKKVRDLERQDEITPQEIAEVGREIKGQLEEAKRTTGFEADATGIGMDVEDEEDLSAEDRKDLLEGARTLEEHSEQVLTEFGVPIEGKKRIVESGKRKGSKLMKEALITEPAKMTGWSSASEYDLTWVLENVCIPKRLAATKSYEKVVEWLEREDPGALEGVTREDFAEIGIT